MGRRPVRARSEPGPRGDFGSIEDSSTLGDSLTEHAERERPGLPLIAQGHSFGSVVTLFRLLDAPDRYRAGVISGAPVIPIPEPLDTDSSFDLDPGWLAEDPFYVDSPVTDPLVCWAEAGWLAHHDALK